MTDPPKETSERAPEHAAPPRCRRCDAPLDAAAEGPFCSRRCQLADLHRWFGGDYRISREIKDSDLETID